MKKQKETISVDITMNHYGFYHSDNHFGNEHKPYRDWVVKKTGIKKSILKSREKCSKITSFGTSWGGPPSHFFDGFWHPGPKWCPRGLQGEPRGAQSHSKF